MFIFVEFKKKFDGSIHTQKHLFTLLVYSIQPLTLKKHDFRFKKLILMKQKKRL